MQIIILPCSKALPAPQYPRYKIQTPWHGGLQPVPSPASSCPCPFTPRAPVILKCSQADLNVKARASRPSSQLPLLLTLTLTHQCRHTRHTQLHTWLLTPLFRSHQIWRLQEDLGISTPKHPWHQLSTCINHAGLPWTPSHSPHIRKSEGYVRKKGTGSAWGHLC